MIASGYTYDQRGQIVWCDTLEAARTEAVAAQAAIPDAGFLYASTNREVEALNRLEQRRRRAKREAAGESIAEHDFRTVRGKVSLTAGERVQFYRTEAAIGVATSEFGTARAVTAESVEVAKDDGSVIRFDPRTYDQWGLGYSGTGYKGQGKTQPQTAAVYDNPYAWDARAAYVIGTRHRDDYRLFVSRDLVPDLEALAEQILRQRDDRGSSLRFATAGELQVRQDQLATAARATLRAALGKSREVRAAKAAREREQQRQQAAVEKTLSRHRAALTQSAQDRKKLAAAWRGGAEDTTALARLVTSGWEAARAIAGNPALLAALREEDPDQASEVEAFARQDRGMLIAAAQRRMPPPTPTPDPEPEPDPEPPSPGMRR